VLYEAYYPSEGSDNHPVQIFYGFVQEGFEKDYQLTLVVFYPKLTGTSLFNLSDENNLDKDETAYLLNRLKEVNYGDFNKVFGE